MRNNFPVLAAKWAPRVAVVLSLAACDQSGQPAAPTTHVPSTPSYTAASGSTSTLLGRSTFGDPFKIHRVTGNWRMAVESNPLDVAVQQIVFAPGSQSGWHSHPGPVFIMVTQGTITFYESNDPGCTPIVRTAGQGYLDEGNHAHLARNETAHEARNIVTYFAPPGAALRIDQPKPANCPF